MKALKVEGMEIMKVKDEGSNRMSRLDLCISSLDLFFLNIFCIMRAAHRADILQTDNCNCCSQLPG